MSTDPVAPVSTSGFFPFSIYTIRGSRHLAADHKSGGAGEFTENKRWTSALGFLDTARKTGQILPVLFAAGERITGVIYFACIDDLIVSPPAEHGNGTTTIRFSALQPLRPQHPLRSLILRSSGEPLSDDFIKPYAICHTPDFLPPPVPKHAPVTELRVVTCREAPSTKQALKLRTFQIGSPRKRDEGIRIGTVRYTPHGVRKSDYVRHHIFDLWFPTLAPSRKLMEWARERDFDEHWDTFAQRYEREMTKQTDSRQALFLLAHLAQKTALSIGCYCGDESRCHRSVLHKLIVRAARNKL